MTSPNRLTLAASALATVVLLSACGSAAGPSTTSSPGASPAEQGQAGEAATGNENSFRYDNARFHYRVSAPGAMAENPDGSAAFKGQVERFEIRVITGTGAADPMGVANGDLAQVQASAASYHLEGNVQKVTISGRQVVKFVYTWVDGTSPVTGKPVSLTTVRYYIPRDSSTLAVLAYSSVTNQYDPQGADDIAMTFQWR
jgi:hypothetical protein